MNKTVSMSIIILMVIGGLIGITNITSLNAQGMNVSGIFSTDTTWALSGSPYIVTDNILVEEGATLIIEPGVDVRFDGDYYLKIDGGLVAIGTDDNMITFTSNNGNSPGSWDTIYFKRTSIDANYTAEGNYVEGSILKYCRIEYGGSQYEHFNEVFNYGAIAIENANPHIEYNIITDNVQGIAHEFSRSKIINNTIQRNERYGIKGHGSFLHIQDNIIRNNGGGCYGKGTIIGNVISENNGLGLWFYGEDLSKVQYNYIANNGESGIYVYGGPTLINYNSIHSNGDYQITRVYDGHGSDEEAVDATNNWWGTTDSNQIDELIYDFYDDFALGKVIYEPFLTEPNLNVPDPPPPLDDNGGVPDDDEGDGHTPTFEAPLFLTEMFIAIAILVTVILLVVILRKRKSSK